MNDAKLARITKAVAGYGVAIWGAEQAKFEPEAQTVGDMIADLLHLCDARGYDFDWQVEKARDHFTAEKNGEDPEPEPEAEPDRDHWEIGDRAGAWDFGDRGEIIGFTDGCDDDGFAFALVKLDFGTTDNQPVTVSVQDLSILSDE
jgi:hypothetical protein